MRGLRWTRPFIFLAFLVVAAGCTAAQTVETDRVKSALDIFQVFTTVPEYEIPAVLMRNASGIAILPGVKRIGFVVGGMRGKGVLVVRGKDGGWSRPLFVTITGGSIGWQIGIQSSDIILFFRTPQSVERVLRGKYTIGVDASVAAGSLGRDAAAVTDKDLTAEIYSYSRARGVFAGLAIQGAAIDIDYGANAAYYQKEIAQPSEILSGTDLPDPETAKQLRQGIARYEKSVK
jgi:lipid-binding SYLF domain-containing protein